MNKHSELINEASKTIETLQNLKQEVRIEKAPSEHIRGLGEELCLLKEALKRRDDEIQELEIANNNAEEASNKLNEVLGKNRVKFEKEKNSLVKEHCGEVKSLKKELGEERRERVMIEKKLDKLGLSCAKLRKT